MKRSLHQFVVLLFALAPLLVRAGGEEVVILYNTRVAESRDVADYYAKARQVPKSQIYGFSLTGNEEMSRDEFTGSLQMSLLHRLVSDGLWQFGPVTVPATNGQPEHVEQRLLSSKIRYAVLCYGMPLKIAADAGIHEEIATNVLPELRRNEASVDSELAWLPMAQGQVPLHGPLQNWIYGATNAAMLHPTNSVLLVARLDGPTADIARGLVDKAMQAETNGLWGRAYFDVRNIADPNYQMGDVWIRGAAEISQQLGFETVVDEKPETFPASFPMSQIALYCGWYDGAVSGPFTLPTVEFMPGAFAYHLHSYSAATVRSASQNWVGPLLAKGATCTMGCVNEPYLAGTPNVAMFIARWLGGNMTYGEAAWTAQPVLSWQTTVVGDPLYRPYGKPAQSVHADLEREQSPLLAWSYLRLVNLQLHRVPLAQTTRMLENLKLTANSAVLTEKMADLCTAQGKPSSAITYYQRALALDPSPQQRIRLRLTLGDKLHEQNRDLEAIQDLQKLILETPDYPGRQMVLDKVASLSKPLETTNAPAQR
jgi:uncharacterized protein (TIGR03790 family)